ncbi:hypothetical protein AMATHDRAFT_70451 [Amanita thiersii Skay4041]|uniref:Uncharacterized protein n=1 Tax=Amanita thiersii Skay4041 TaxID=703135 RepID=A0A2A9N8K4_9AGAR|nr:hypothetical protein AMATHDRAFT_70451 [Amanita thiersii Skay4041]
MNKIVRMNHPPIGPSPIRRLSAEVLSEIFVSCLEKRTRSNSIRNCPLTLCRVCSSWRLVALHTPRLWSTLRVDLYRVSTSLTEEALAKHLSNWLNRSGTLPLRLSLNYYKIQQQKQGVDSFCNATLTVFGAFASRWQKVNIILGYEDVEAMLNRFPSPVHAPLLRSLSFWGKEYDQPIPPAFSFPALTKLAWTSKCLALFKSNISWHLLTNVKISIGYSFSTALEVIQLCPNVIHYHVRFIEADYGHTVELEHGTPILNQSIRHLDLTFKSLCISFFSRLILPALSHLSLENEKFSGDGETHPHEAEILGLFSRSRCDLKVLELHNVGFSVHMLIKHESCQTLQKLSCRSSFTPVIDDETLTDLTRIPGKDYSLCPFLEDFEVESPTDLTPGLLGSMILSRCSCSENAGEMLRNVEICTFHSELSKEDENLLNEVDRSACYISMRYLNCRTMRYETESFDRYLEDEDER